MTSTAALLSSAAAAEAHRDGAPLDVHGLRDLAERGLAADGAARRGPFRPEVWLNARQRHAARLAAHYFRAIDVALVVVVTLLCAWAVTPTGLAAATVAQAAPFAVGCVLVLALVRSLDLYRFPAGRPAVLHLAALAGVAAGATGTAVLVGALLSGGFLGAPSLVVWGGVSLATLYALHLVWLDRVAAWRRSGALTPNVVLVGATRHAEALIRAALKRRDVNVLGVFDDRLARSPETVEGVPVLGDSEALLSHRILPFVDRIVVAIDPKAEARVRHLTGRLGSLPNEVTLLVDPVRASDREDALNRLADSRLAPLDGRRDHDRRAFNKRLLDLTVGGLAFVALLPVLGLIAALVKLDSPGPALFRQRRHGFNQEEIVVWKFRSMKHASADATASRQVTHDDDRITRLGRILRSTSLDELPQLLNVISGEMSLVGPRPHAVGMKTGQIESARLVADYAHRHRIKPGMTGWAAIKGSRGPLHSAQDVRRRVQLDVEYVERQSVWMDLWIMLVTVPVLLGDRAAVR
ncbi:MAG: exopolysaccharide biosynthesis polyprenyl glycosylphosphotransferase [Alphaproteobacteria bacterium]|nr:exopolysaccharide biosynthesis polyprenyl glycosylphosphotransferase [Alphaproteobacteria bacterium]MBU1525759.1 exopolysaccharide biosynthesis polyprenyl glycosylphosphotransferase [Alphaproteobacteria bacterium]MBU2116215.1 exopolysaccharide biosynthesis polyprenyl glycosylphosphotransferase [Alphaproteobacteria bacterium]MBU2383107.1 exopolysaccharide biosynthesis polyprenyl glycosylphosphotransferase [Alphaproteobacteria bacterium]